MHPSTLLAHAGLTPPPRPAVRRRTSAAPRRRPLRGAARAGVRRPAVRRRLILPQRLRRAAGGWRVPLIAGLLALALGGLAVLRVWPPFAVVMSGSMAPTINTGDMVVLERLHAPARIGQVVAVDVPDNARARYGYPPVVIHRVFRITPDGQIRTKGDARPQPDPFTVPRTSVDRTVIFRIPSGGRVLAFVHSAPGLLWLAFGVLLFFGLPVLERQREARRREAEATAGLHGQLAAITGELARLHAEQARSHEAADATLSRLDRLTQLVERAGSAAQPSPAVPAGAEQVAAAACASSAAPDANRRAIAGPGAAHVTRGVDEETAGAAAPLSPGAVAVTGGDDATSTPVSNGVAAESLPVAESSIGAEPPAIVESPAAAESPTAESPAAAEPAAGTAVVAFAASPVAVSALPTSAPVTALFVVRPPDVCRTPAPAVRWDAPPCGADVATTGWAAAPVPVPTRRFARGGRLVAASRA